MSSPVRKIVGTMFEITDPGARKYADDILRLCFPKVATGWSVKDISTVEVLPPIPIVREDDEVYLIVTSVNESRDIEGRSIYRYPGSLVYYDREGIERVPKDDEESEWSPALLSFEKALNQLSALYASAIISKACHGSAYLLAKESSNGSAVIYLTYITDAKEVNTTFTGFLSFVHYIKMNPSKHDESRRRGVRVDLEVTTVFHVEMQNDSGTDAGHHEGHLATLYMTLPLPVFRCRPSLIMSNLSTQVYKIQSNLYARFQRVVFHRLGISVS